MPHCTLHARRPRAFAFSALLPRLTSLALAGALALGTLGILGTLGATAAGAQPLSLSMTLGDGGTLYAVKTGTYGSLFGSSSGSGEQAAVSAATPVLALQTTSPGGQPQLQLVPTTDDAAVESSPALLYEQLSKTLFIVWVSTSDQVASSIKLVSLSGGPGGQWSQPITIISNPYAAKTTPQLTVTRDSYQEFHAHVGATAIHHRTILHIVWSEDSASGAYQAQYAPVIFEDGAWIGTVPTPILLNSFDLAEQSAPAAAAPQAAPLASAPSIQGGRDASTVIAGFASAVSGNLDAVEVEALPEDVRALADTSAAAITNLGSQYFPGQLSALAAVVQSTLVANGGTLQSGTLQAIAAEAQTQVLAGAPDLPTLAQKTRAVIIDTGFKISAARGLLPIVWSSGAVEPPQVVEIVPPSGPSQFIQARVAAVRTAPALPAAIGTGGPQIFLSRTGDNAIVSWPSTDGSALNYVSTQADGTWSNGYQLQLAPTFNLTQALQVVQGQVY